MTMAPSAVRVNLASMWVKIAGIVPKSLKDSPDVQAWFDSLKEEVKVDDQLSLLVEIFSSSIEIF